MKQFLDYAVSRQLKAATLADLDNALFDYIFQEFSSPGRDGKGHANKVLSAVKFYLPEVRGHLHFAHRAMSGWDRLRPSQQITPCPHDVALRIAYFLRCEERYAMSLAVLLSFDCHLRVSECLRLKRSDVVFMPPPSQRVILVLGRCKGGTNQSVEVRFSLVRELLLRQWDPLPPSGKLFAFNADSFRKEIHAVFNTHIASPDSTWKITPHSLRHGGATRDFVLKRLSLPDLKDRSRWKNEDTLYNYIQVAKMHMVRVQVKDSVKPALQKLNCNPGTFFNVSYAGVGWDSLMIES
ncbi:MAG: site-specific integrase [Pseudomonadota bacterium]